MSETMKLLASKITKDKNVENVLQIKITEVITHLVTRRRGDVVTTSHCTSQRRRRYVSNETPNDVSVVRLRDILLERRDDVSEDVTTTSHQCVSSTSPTSLK